MHGISYGRGQQVRTSPAASTPSKRIDRGLGTYPTQKQPKEF